MKRFTEFTEFTEEKRRAMRIDSLDAAFMVKSREVFNRYLRVRDRMPELLEWASWGVNDGVRWPHAKYTIHDIHPWIEWIFTGSSRWLRNLPEGLIPVQPTDLDDDALENYGGRGYEKPPKLMERWQEAEEMAAGEVVHPLTNCVKD